MRAILIAPDHSSRSIYSSYVEVMASKEDAYCYAPRHVQQLLDCATVQEQDLGGAYAGHVVIMDERFLMRPHPGYIFHPQLHPGPLGGKLLILGFDLETDVYSDVRLEQAAIAFDLADAYCLPARARELAQRRDAELRRQLPRAIFTSSADLMAAAHGSM